MRNSQIIISINFHKCSKLVSVDPGDAKVLPLPLHDACWKVQDRRHFPARQRDWARTFQGPVAIPRKLHQRPLKIWTYHSFFCKYNLGPSLKIEYLKSGWEYQRASFIGLKFGISRITRLWFQVFKWLHL